MNYIIGETERLIGRDIVTRQERMRAFEPYGEYHDRRAQSALIIAGATLAATALAESVGINASSVRAAVEAVGTFTIPIAAGALAGAGYYVTRKDLPGASGRYGALRLDF